MSAGESIAGPGRRGERTSDWLRVPCLHNPAHHEIAAHINGQTFVWIDLEGPTEADLRKVGEHIPLHPLTIEDARRFSQRPKVEEYEGYMYMVVFGVDETADKHILREVHLIISGDAVITIHRHPFDALDALRGRYTDQPIRSEQFLVWAVLDAVTGTFGPVLENMDESIDDLELDVFDAPTEDQLRQIFALRRELVGMRRVVSPMRDMLQRSADRIAQLPGLQADDRLYFRDLYDGLIRTSEILDAYRDLLSGATDLYLSTVANRQGEVNRQLTIIATIFLPLTFFTGFFGQNFSLLTGHIIDSDWSFWVFGIGLLVVSVLGFWLYFRRRGWIGRATAAATRADRQSP